MGLLIVDACHFYYKFPHAHTHTRTISSNKEEFREPRQEPGWKG